eukprot:1080081-Rhodomonas_salina.1
MPLACFALKQCIAWKRGNHDGLDCRTANPTTVTSENTTIRRPCHHDHHDHHHHHHHHQHHDHPSSQSSPPASSSTIINTVRDHTAGSNTPG